MDTRFLRNEFDQSFVGAASSFVTGNNLATLRLDPEGIRVGPKGTFFISDEYGPYMFEFDRPGRLVRRFCLDRFIRQVKQRKLWVVG